MPEITRNPLCWPNNVGRTAPQNRTWPKFDQQTVAAATNHVLQEINRLNSRRWDYSDASVIISTNVILRRDGLPASNLAEPSDTGAAVYFTLRFFRNGKAYERPCVLSCDRWNKVGYNLTAIAKDIEAQRARQRWGCTTIEQAFQGYVAIPEKCGGKPWWDTLGVPPTANRDEITKAYKLKAQCAHPDHGGSHAEWTTLQESYDQAMASFR